mgnify:FL=1
MEVKRYDIVQADLSGTVESEQGGVRPVLIIQNDTGNLHSPTTIVIPFSTKIFKNPNQPTHTLIKRSADTGLKEDSVLLGEQIRVISYQRIKKKIGTVTDEYEKKEIRRIYDANFGE